MKVADIGEEDLRKRAQEEVKNHYAPTVEMVMETKGVEITPQIENMLILPALLPAYVLNCGEVKAVVNGQTGRVAVSAAEEVKDKSWYKKPILITIGVFLLCVAACYFFLQPADFGFGIRMSAILTLIAGLMAGGIYSEKRKERFFRPIFQSSQTIREQQDPQPIFLEPEDGQWVPAKINFYTPKRVALWCVFLILWNTLPLYPALLFALFRVQQMWFGGLGIWLCIAVPATFAMILKLFRLDVYNYPLVRRILEDGTIGSKLKANQADSGFKGFFKEILTSGSKPFFVGIGIFILVLALVIAIGG